MVRIKRALISVSDKAGLGEFVKVLNKFGVEILSTGGTAKMIRDSGVPAKDVSEHTGFPEMLDGRVKTLHPKIHGGLLSLRDNPEHMQTIKEHNIGLIDMVVVNLYPFEKTIEKPGVSIEEVIENIDIGGPSMLRSAAKNHVSITVIVDPADYAVGADELAKSGPTTLATRQRLAAVMASGPAAVDIRDVGLRKTSAVTPDFSHAKARRRLAVRSNRSTSPITAPRAPYRSPSSMAARVSVSLRGRAMSRCAGLRPIWASPGG